MLRGINRQDIFEDKEDYARMLRCMEQMLEQYDEQGNRLPPLCTLTRLETMTGAVGRNTLAKCQAQPASVPLTLR